MIVLGGAPLAASAGRSGTATTATDDQAVAFQVGASHDGTQVDATLYPPLVAGWSAGFTNEYLSYPLIAGGRVFVINSNVPASGAALYGFDLGSGTPLWPPVDLGSSSTFNNAAYEAGRLFVVGGDGEVRAVDAATGQGLWFTQLAGQTQFSGAPTALNGTVYTTGAGFGGTLYAINEADGSIRWTAPINNGDHSSPVVTGGAVYVSSACDEAYAFNPSTGTRIWVWLACRRMLGKTSGC